MKHPKKLTLKVSAKTIQDLIDTEPHCSLTVDGNILVSGNLKKPNELGLVNSSLLTMEQFLVLKLEKNVKNIHLDHGNRHSKTTDKEGNTWYTRVAVWEYDENGKRHHRFASAVLREVK